MYAVGIIRNEWFFFGMNQMRFILIWDDDVMENHDYHDDDSKMMVDYYNDSLCIY